MDKKTKELLELIQFACNEALSKNPPEYQHMMHNLTGIFQAVNDHMRPKKGFMYDDFDKLYKKAMETCCHCGKPGFDAGLHFTNL